MNKSIVYLNQSAVDFYSKRDENNNLQYVPIGIVLFLVQELAQSLSQTREVPVQTVTELFDAVPEYKAMITQMMENLQKEGISPG
jgi:uncharacterized membrane protein YecN with MAPEG domain